MTKDEFFDLIAQFSRRPLPALSGRHLYLWHGAFDLLKEGIPPALFVHLDLHHLATTLPRAPNATGEASRLLRQSLQTTLQARRSPQTQQIFVITGCDLLSRYRIALAPFFQHVSEECMVVLVVSPTETTFRPSTPLPEYVLLNSSAPFDYLRAVVGEAATVSTL